MRAPEEPSSLQVAGGEGTFYIDYLGLGSRATRLKRNGAAACGGLALDNYERRRRWRRPGAQVVAVALGMNV